jgi:hypothetical protein
MAAADPRGAAGSLIVSSISPSKTPAPSCRLPAVSLLTEQDAFLFGPLSLRKLEAVRRRAGGVDGVLVWRHRGTA